MLFSFLINFPGHSQKSSQIEACNTMQYRLVFIAIVLKNRSCEVIGFYRISSWNRYSYYIVKQIIELFY